MSSIRFPSHQLSIFDSLILTTQVRLSNRAEPYRGPSPDAWAGSHWDYPRDTRPISFRGEDWRMQPDPVWRMQPDPVRRKQPDPAHDRNGDGWTRPDPAHDGMFRRRPDFRLSRRNQQGGSVALNGGGLLDPADDGGGISRRRLPDHSLIPRLSRRDQQGDSDALPDRRPGGHRRTIFRRSNYDSDEWHGESQSKSDAWRTSSSSFRDSRPTSESVVNLRCEFEM